MTLNFSNRNFIITGASKGLGLEVSRRFSKLGANLALLARDSELLSAIETECSLYSKSKAFSIDLLDLGAIESRIKDITKYFGHIDGIIHVAGGGYGLREPLIDYIGFEKLMKINILSAAEINRFIVPQMISIGFGNIVHIGSIAGSEAVASVGYNSAKAALGAYVRSIGREMAKYGIIANGLSPGGFHAPGNAMDRLMQNNPQAYEKFISERIPRGKMGNFDELLPIIELLASKNAGMFCGCMVAADGGEGVRYA